MNPQYTEKEIQAILEDIKVTGFKTNHIRQAYEEEVKKVSREIRRHLQCRSQWQQIHSGNYDSICKKRAFRVKSGRFLTFDAFYRRLVRMG